MVQKLKTVQLLLVDPDRSKLLSQEYVATAPTPYSPLARAAESYEILPLSGVVNGRQVSTDETVMWIILKRRLNFFTVELNIP